MTNTHILIVALVAFFGSLVLTPIAKKISNRFGLIDDPGKRKIHDVSVPRGGGLAIYAAFMLAFIAMGQSSRQVVGYMLSTLMIVAVGVADDKYSLRAVPKFIIQSLAAVIAMYFGIRINMDLFLVGHLSQYAWLSTPLTFFWIVGVTNAINIVDGLDGLAAGVSTIAALAVSAVAFLSGEPIVGAMALALGMSSLGFLPHNFRSRIFMGDSGSLFLGFSLATLAIMGSLKLTAAFSLLVPVTILLIPIFDTLFAIVRRILKGQSIFEGDRKHFHHRLLDLGFTPLQAVLFIYSLSLVFSSLAIYASQVRARNGYLIFGVSLILLISVTSLIVYLHQLKTNHI